jgi:hypothetical protein
MAIKHSSSVPETCIIVEIISTARQYYLLTALLFLGFYRLLPHSHGYYCATSLTFSNGTPLILHRPFFHTIASHLKPRNQSVALLLAHLALLPCNLPVLCRVSSRSARWSMSNRMTADLVCSALNMALFRRGFPKSVIVHSDRGSQYCSHDYRDLIKKHQLVQSMSRKGPM